MVVALDGVMFLDASNRGLHGLQLPPATLLHGIKSATPREVMREQAAALEDVTTCQGREGKPSEWQSKLDHY
jgi:hypothetical protein